jgi:hypothetical protein
MNAALILNTCPSFLFSHSPPFYYYLPCISIPTTTTSLPHPHLHLTPTLTRPYPYHPQRESVCKDFHYNFTHNPIYYQFDYVNWNEIYNQTALWKAHLSRRARLVGCTHAWPEVKDELAMGNP